MLIAVKVSNEKLGLAICYNLQHKHVRRIVGCRTTSREQKF